MTISFKKLLTSYWANYAGFSRDIWIQFSAILINSIGWMVSLYLSLYLRLELGYSVSAIGGVILFFGFGFLVGNYIGGHLCDSIKPRTIVIYSLVFLGLFTITLAFVTHVLLLIVIFLAGFSNGSFRPASNLLILSYSDDINRTRVIGIRRVAINLGVALAGMIGGAVVSFGYPIIFYFDGISSIIAAIVLIVYCKNPPKSSKNYHKNSANTEKPVNILQNYYFLALCFFGLIASMVYVQVKTVYPIYLHDHYHILVQQIAYFSTINGFMIMFIEIPLLTYLRKMRQELVAAIGGFCICFGFAVLPLGLSFSFAIFSCVIYTMGEIMLYPTMMVLALDSSQGHNKGKFMGMYQFILSIPELFGPVVGATIYQYASPSLLWFICGLAGIIVFIGFYKLKVLTLPRELKPVISEAGT